MKILFLDDVRNPKDCGYRDEDCVVVRNVQEAIKTFFSMKFDLLSLDHDLGMSETGYDFLCILEDFAHKGLFKKNPLPEFVVHSANPVGKSRMLMAIDKIKIIVKCREC
jgi:hypothetical protein